METIKAALALAILMIEQITPELAAVVDALGKAKHRVDFLTRMLVKEPGYQSAQTLLVKATTECEVLEPKVEELKELLQHWQTEATCLRIAQYRRAQGRAFVREFAGAVKPRPRLN